MANKKAETSAAPAAATPDNATENTAASVAEVGGADTSKTDGEGSLPETMAVEDPAPATEMESPSGAFIEPEIKAAIPVEHPAVDNNPRAGTSAVQNGGDFNDPRRRHPGDPDFTGQGLDMSVYGNVVAETKAED